MKTLKCAYALATAACLLSAAPAQAQLLWTGFVTAHAVQQGNDVWLVCEGNAELTESLRCPAGPKTSYLVFPDLVPPKVQTLQQILDSRTKAPPGFRAVAVGPLPFGYAESSKGGPRFYLDERSVNIAYRLEKSDKWD